MQGMKTWIGETASRGVGIDDPEPNYRVYLAVPAAEDAKEFFTLMQENIGTLHPWVDPPGSLQTCRIYLASLDSPERKGYLVRLRRDDRIIGIINLNEIVRHAFQSAYLGYYSGRPFQGRGYMTEGLTLVLRKAFVELKLHRLEANIQPGNKRSIALVKGCGFSREGYSPKYLKICGKWKDHQRWAILAEDWLSKNRVGNLSD